MISVCVLTLNAEEALERLLHSVKSFPEVIILDSGSTDRTLAIASCFSNVKIYENPFLGFGKMRNLAACKAQNDWILVLDADEWLLEEDALAIQNLDLKREKVYEFRFVNIFQNRKIRFAWGKDRHTRLYHRGVSAFDEAFVHEGLKLDGVTIERTSQHIQHESYREISDFLQKMELYSTYFAKQRCGGRRVTLWTALFHSFFAFMKTYFFRLGFLDGSAGWIIANYNGHVAYYKYLKLRELQASCSKS